MAQLYSKLRPDMKTGDLLMWKTTRIGSLVDILLLLYQKMLGATYTHVGVLVKEGNRIFVVEATPPVVRLFPLSMAGNFYHIPLDITPNEKHIDFLLSNLGKKYSLFDFIRSTFRIMNNNDDFYCSEFCSFFYNQIGLIDNDEAGLTPDYLVSEVVRVTGKQPVSVKNDKGNLDVL